MKRDKMNDTRLYKTAGKNILEQLTGDGTQYVKGQTAWL